MHRASLIRARLQSPELGQHEPMSKRFSRYAIKSSHIFARPSSQANNNAGMGSHSRDGHRPPDAPRGSDLRIAHVIAPGAVGGAESVVRALALGRQRFVGPTMVVALVEQPGRHPYAEGLRRQGIPTAEIETGRRRYVSEARAIARVLRD